MKKIGFKRALCRKAAFLLMLVMLITGLCGSVSAESIQKDAYDTYTFWTAPGKRWAVSATPMYEFKKSITGGDLGISAFNELSDVTTDKDGLIYIADKGNGRIVVLNSDGSLKTIISGLSYNGQNLDIKGTCGVFVTKNKDIYIADTEHERVVVTDISGKVKKIITLPQADVMPENFKYRPYKVAVDSDGFTYVLSEGSYYGALLYKPDGTFSGFFGSNSVTTSILGVFKKLYNAIFLTEEKRMAAERTLPYSFTDITVDDENFVYTATGAITADKGQSGQLKKLSPGGKNVLKNKTTSNVKSAENKDFSDGVNVRFAKDDGWFYWVSLDLATMDVDKYGYMYATDRVSGHTFIYDQECNMMTAFGGGMTEGTQRGTFTRASAVAVNNFNQDVIITDEMGKTVTIFKETEYGAFVKKAQSLTKVGSYVEAKPYWEQVLRMDRNNQLAYRGLARAALVEEDYETAREYAKQGFDQDTYASAFTNIRNEYLSKNFAWIFILAVIVVGGLLAVLVYTNKHELHLIKNIKVKTMFQCLLHPFEGAKQIRYYNNGSVKLATLVFVIYLISSICGDIYQGFMHSMFDKSSYSAAFTIFRDAGIVLLWTVVNWAMSTLFQGKGKIKHIYIITCYALIPLIINNILATCLTNILSVDEGLVISAINIVCLALTGIIICVGTMTAHEFGFFKFIGMTLVTIFGMLVAIFVLSMLYVLVYQMINFIGIVYKEVSYR